MTGFAERQGSFSEANDAIAITPANADLGYTTRGLYVGVTGNVTVVTRGGNTVLFTAVPAGAILPVRCVRVAATGTTASGIVGFL